MNHKTKILTILSLFLLLYACKKKEEVAPVEEAPPPPPPVEETVDEVEEEPKPVVEVDQPSDLDAFDPSKFKMGDVNFDFDKYNLRDDAIATLRRHVETLRANPELKVLIEGHCDERGTEEYNIGLGERRANRVFEYLVAAGIDESRLKTISYGEMRPKAMGSNEEAWAINRRAEFKLSK